MSDSNESGGYGKPPKESQFKPGQSGNPKGRPKDSKSLKTIVQKELAGKLEIKVQGTKKKVTKLEAAVMKLVNDALTGNVKSLSELLKLAATYAPTDDTSGAETLPPSEEDQALLQAFVKRMSKKMNKEAPNDL